VVESPIYLIRHGESVANTEGIYQGQTYDTDLSSLGRKQACALAERLEQEPIARLVASPLKRTRQTAETIANRHQGLVIECEPKIMETNHGAWEGRHIEDIIVHWPHEYRTWQERPSQVLFPAGEAFADTYSRTLAWWDGVTQEACGLIVVVTHDNIIRALLVGTLGQRIDEMWGYVLQPAAITKVTVIDGEARVNVINDTKHLEGLQANLAKHAL